MFQGQCEYMLFLHVNQTSSDTHTSVQSSTSSKTIHKLDSVVNNHLITPTGMNTEKKYILMIFHKYSKTTGHILCL